MEKKPQPLKVFFRKTYLNDVAVYTQQIEDILAVEPYGIHAIDHQHTWRVGTTWACRWLRLVCTQQCTLIHNKYLCINNGLVTTVSGHFLKRITGNWKQNEIRKKTKKFYKKPVDWWLFRTCSQQPITARTILWKCRLFVTHWKVIMYTNAYVIYQLERVSNTEIMTGIWCNLISKLQDRK